MTQELTDGVKVGSLVKRVGCKGVTQGMDAAGFCYAGFFLAL
jgi:hypothetical protein